MINKKGHRTLAKKKKIEHIKGRKQTRTKWGSYSSPLTKLYTKSCTRLKSF
jgi:hypothetical protein